MISCLEVAAPRGPRPNLSYRGAVGTATPGTGPDAVAAGTLLEADPNAGT